MLPYTAREILRWEIVLDYLSGPNVIIRSLKERSRKDREADIMVEAKLEEKEI